MKKNDVWKFIYTLVSSLIYSFGVSMFLEPAKLYSGGVAGLSQLFVNSLDKFLGISLNLGVIVFVLNIPFLFLAYFGISKKYCFFTAFSVIIQTVVLGFIPTISIPGVDILTNAIMGGLICGLGIALALRWGVSTGSLDVVAQYFSLKKGMSVGNVTLLVNCSIAIMAGILFEPAKAVYTLIRIVLNSFMIDKIHTSYNSIQVHIITDFGDQISEELIKATNHTVTKLDCIGQYQHKKRDFLEIIVAKYEVTKVLSCIRGIDKKAFVYTSHINKIYGNFQKKVID